jgi:ADP-heptose:LPS heptosyltransferase
VHGHVLVARLDSLGDLLVTGPAVRAVAATASRVTLLVGPGRGDVARLLPGVDDVIEYEAPWVVPDARALDAATTLALVERLRAAELDAALVVTSFHQSPLPLALLLRLAGVGWVGAISEDYPGSLLDLRHRVPEELAESERALSLARAAGFPATGPATLAVRGPLPDVSVHTGLEPYVVFHPGADAEARRPTAEHSRSLVAGLVAAGYRVLVTGSGGERTLTGYVAAGLARDLGGALRLPELAAVLERAEVVVAPNTGPAHLAAAVGTPVVSLFAPVVPAVKWAPYGVPRVLLGDQTAPCRETRARVCPVPGHPCLSSITPGAVVAAVAGLAADARANRSRKADHVLLR